MLCSFTSRWCKLLTRRIKSYSPFCDITLCWIINFVWAYPWPSLTIRYKTVMFQNKSASSRRKSAVPSAVHTPSVCRHSEWRGWEIFSRFRLKINILANHHSIKLNINTACRSKSKANFAQTMTAKGWRRHDGICYYLKITPSTGKNETCRTLPMAIWPG